MSTTAIFDLKNDYVTGGAADDTWFDGVADALDLLRASREELDLSGNSDVTPTAAVARALILTLTGTLTGSINLILPAWDGCRWLIINSTSGAYTVTVKTAAGTGVAITQGYSATVYGDGTNIVRASPGQSGDTTRLINTILAGLVSSPVATVQNLTTGATITLPTGGKNKRLSASGGSVTGIILAAGTVDGQELTLFNIEASNTITFAAAGTSNVADGTSAVIAALRAIKLTWDATSARWYRTG